MWVGGQKIWHHNVVSPRRVDVQCQNHRGRLGAIINHFVAYPDLDGSLF